MSAILASGFGNQGGQRAMRPEDFRPDDLFAQIQGLVDGLAEERRAREAAAGSEEVEVIEGVEGVKTA